MIMYICSSEFMSFEHFFMWDKWILFLTFSELQSRFALDNANDRNMLVPAYSRA